MGTVKIRRHRRKQRPCVYECSRRPRRTKKIEPREAWIFSALPKIDCFEETIFFWFALRTKKIDL